MIDLCAAPGSWCQVASERCPVNSLIIGVDLDRIKPLPNVITFQSDITTEHCRSELRSIMKTWKADTILHDGAPNVGKDWIQDAFTQSDLVLKSLKLAVEFLAQGGIFVTKVFRSKDYTKLMWIFQQFFESVEATKPPSSRNVSAEIFVVCKRFKAPKKYDPKLLDPRYVFEEVDQVNNQSLEKILNPEKKKRKREGYEEGDYTQHHECSVMELIKSNDPIQILGSYNTLVLDKKDPELKPVRHLEQTTDELLECFKDLKVLGRREFRMILKWRKAARAALKLDGETETKPEGEEKEEELDEETKIDLELDALKDKERRRLKREKRRLNEKKQKEIIRMQMDMVSDMRIGTETNDDGKSLFNLTSAEKSGKLKSILKGKFIPSEEPDDFEISIPEPTIEDDDRSEEDIIDDMEAEMDAMYEEFKERQAEKKASFKSKRARDTSGYHDEWYGMGDEDEESDQQNISANNGEDSDEEFTSDDEDYQTNAITTLLPKTTSTGLSTKAAMFFDNSLFKDVDLNADDASSATNAKKQQSQEKAQSNPNEDDTPGSEDDQESEDENDFASSEDDEDDNKDWNEDEEDEGPAVPDIVTPQAMTIAHDLALGNINKHRLVDEGFNRFAFRDTEGLPEWFLEDEQKHNRVLKPVTKEAAEAIKAKLKALNARPIKKVAEAKARKQMRRIKRLEKLRKKTELINEDTALSERDKADEIQKLTKKYSMIGGKKKKEKPRVTVVVARGNNRGIQGRPRGVKGRYKMVDGVAKKEQRALKRIAKRRKK